MLYVVCEGHDCLDLVALLMVLFLLDYTAPLVPLRGEPSLHDKPNTLSGKREDDFCPWPYSWFIYCWFMDLAFRCSIRESLVGLGSRASFYG